jgi:hypothetical protein
MEDRDNWSRTSSVVLGLLLIVAGVAFLVMQWYSIDLPFDLGSVGWPLFIIAPGVVLLLVGLFLPAAPGSGLTIAGSIVTTVGLILAYQASTDHYASWAYAWALVAPASVGAGMFLWGLLHVRGRMVREGLGALAVGVVLFIVGFAFFEGVLNVGGGRGLAPLGRQALPIALIVAGLAVIVSRLWPRRRGRVDWPVPPASPQPLADAPAGAPVEAMPPSEPVSANQSAAGVPWSTSDSNWSSSAPRPSAEEADR